MKFFPPEAALYLYKSTIGPWKKQCCDIQAGAPRFYLDMLDKLQKWVCRTDVSTLAASIEPLAYRRNAASSSLFYRYNSVKSSSELVELLSLSYYCWSSSCYSDRLHYFSSSFLRCYKVVYVNSFFLRTAGLWNSLPTECIPLTQI